MSGFAEKGKELANNVPSLFTTKTQTVVGESQLPALVFDTKNILILVLLIILILSILGVNLFALLANLTQTVSNAIGPVATDFWKIFGYTSGTIINETSDILADVSKTGIDLADGAIHDVGDILKDSINTSSDPISVPNIPLPTQALNPIASPVSSSKGTWCLVGEYKGSRGCVEVGSGDTCMSNQLFPNKQMCLNPTMTAT